MFKSFFSLFTFILLGLLVGVTQSQEIKLKSAKSWQVGGRVQMQHLYNSNIDDGDNVTTNGFRMRRGRLWVKAKLSEWVSTKIQISVRDKKPSVLDLEAKLKIFQNYYFRLGQYKVPVWREELRSSGKLLLVERSLVAEFLADYQLAARQIGVEFGRVFESGASFALNYSNGAGAGAREDAGRTKDDFVNNGKLYTARINLPLGNIAEIGVSAMLNQVGYYDQASNHDNRGNVSAIAPDFGLYLPCGLDVEGGIVLGSVSKDFSGLADDEDFFLSDVTARWKKKLNAPLEAWAGMDAFEFAAGISYINPNASSGYYETLMLRFGPAVYFGKHARLQINAELDQPADDAIDSTVLIRTQATINF